LNKTHVSSVKDGAIIMFPGSVVYWMKVCSRDGIGGVVNLNNGLYVPVSDLVRYELGLNCYLVADSLDKLLMEDEDE